MGVPLGKGVFSLYEFLKIMIVQDPGFVSCSSNNNIKIILHGLNNMIHNSSCSRYLFRSDFGAGVRRYRVAKIEFDTRCGTNFKIY